MQPLRQAVLTVAMLAALIGGGCATKSAATKAQPAPSSTATTKAASPKLPLSFQVAGILAAPFRLLPHKKPGPPKAQAAQVIGTVKMVNKEDGFVLIDAYVYQSASVGDTLLCISDEKETATLRMSTLRSPPFLIADIKDGTPAVGDRVYKP